MLRNAVGVGMSDFPEKKRYEGVWVNIISVKKEGVGFKYAGKRYVTLEWPL